MERQRTANYLTSVLLGADSLGTELVSREQLLRRRLRNHAIKAVVWPMTIIYNCLNTDILKGEERKETAWKLIREISAVMRGNLLDLTPDLLAQYVGNYIVDPPTELNPLISDVVQGIDNDIDMITGWTMKYGEQHNPPYLCPTNRKVLQQVKDIAEQVKEHWARLEEGHKEALDRETGKEYMDETTRRSSRHQSRRKYKARDMDGLIKSWIPPEQSAETATWSAPKDHKPATTSAATPERADEKSITEKSTETRTRQRTPFPEPKLAGTTRMKQNSSNHVDTKSTNHGAKEGKENDEEAKREASQSATQAAWKRLEEVKKEFETLDALRRSRAKADHQHWKDGDVVRNVGC
ncbi:uncharacterized protein LY89DRAFT_705796 [Mollisia scopiformis]|uniref:Ketopantoate reductase C-terminal domain-containing protein n=1 Tax=Mollisia scopiformis TaxID=149040 RepID=A0A194XJL1_MOLSC|nr:uncharacterized protein LY89DRAFT_705796 [Mollisia scopiformis]KUJ19957.1 hypothetical protein LY89DRAFT_705796 [Mollisia scopiformis]